MSSLILVTQIFFLSLYTQGTNCHCANPNATFGPENNKKTFLFHSFSIFMTNSKCTLVNLLESIQTEGL